MGATEVARVTRPIPEGGLQAAYGTCERNKQAVRMRNALGSMLEKADREVSCSYEAPMWRKLEDNTKKPYT